MIKGFLTTGQAAEELDVSTARIRQLILRGHLKNTKKVGGVILIPEKEIQRFRETERPVGRPRKLK